MSSSWEHCSDNLDHLCVSFLSLHPQLDFKTHFPTIRPGTLANSLSYISDKDSSYRSDSFSIGQFEQFLCMTDVTVFPSDSFTAWQFEQFLRQFEQFIRLTVWTDSVSGIPNKVRLTVWTVSLSDILNSFCLWQFGQSVYLKLWLFLCTTELLLLL